MTEPLINRLAALAVEVARDTGYPLSDYVDKSDTELLDLVLRFQADAYGPAGATTETDLPDPTWPTAEQMLSSPPPYASGQPAGTLTVNGHTIAIYGQVFDPPLPIKLQPEGYFTAEPRGPVEPGGDDTPGV